MKFTIIFVIFAVAVVQFSSADFTCTPGVPYKENNCNSCFCIEPYDILVCERIACSDEDYPALQNCVVGTTTQRGCNTCICVQDLGTICTNKDC